MFKRIMVPVETEEKSQTAIKIAYEFGQLHKTEIILFNVISAKSLDVTTREATQGHRHMGEGENAPAADEAPRGGGREERRKALEEDRYKMLYSVKRSAPDDRMKVFIDIVEGDPATMISEVAQKNKVDLIIIPKSGKIGPRRVLVGDVAIKVAEMTDIPLMLVPS